MFQKAMNRMRPEAVILSLTCALIFAVAPRCAAQNLVPNPSFELMVTCPTLMGFSSPAYRPTGWDTFSDTPDYFHACAPDSAPNAVPLSVVSFQHPHQGEAFVGLAAWEAGNFREMPGA
jgi:hypothetical protein